MSAQMACLHNQQGTDQMACWYQNSSLGATTTHTSLSYKSERSSTWGGVEGRLTIEIACVTGLANREVGVETEREAK